MTCTLCPRACGALRLPRTGSGACGMGTDIVAARAAPHFWEEPCISGDRGSGAVFFSGCPLNCVFCQNRQISAERYGKPVTVERLGEIFRELVNLGVHNINLVSPTHFAPAIIETLRRDKPPVPVIWNSSGYESVSTLRALEGLVDIYLPDMKYALEAPARRYSAAPDYFLYAQRAILEMYRQTGDYVLDENGMLQSGVVIRHLVLPSNLENTFRVIDWAEETFTEGQVMFSLMSQFTPTPACADYPEINRPLSEWEQEQAVGYFMDSTIMDGFYQELDASGEGFVPKFDLTGI